MAKEIVVKQDEEKPIAVEILAASILAFDKATKRMVASGLTNRAIALLINDAMRPVDRISVTKIEDVLRELPRLAEIYTRRRKVTK
jgi:glutaredoxin-related protein